MADLSITAANVKSYSTEQENGIAGGAVTRGMAVRKNTSSQWVAAQSDSAVNAAATGIALNDAAAGQPLAVHKGGPIDLGVTLTVGWPYMLGTSNGAIKPVGDIAGTEYATYLGFATAANRLEFRPVTAAALAGAAVT
jgi:hypothetical protein